MVNHLEKSIIQHMMADNHKVCAEAELDSSYIDSAYHSMSQLLLQHKIRVILRHQLSSISKARLIAQKHLKTTTRALASVIR
jgi:hypothetical protein